MFTGIIEEIGIIHDIKNNQESCTIAVSADKVLVQTKIGDSIAVNGICVTVTSCTKSIFFADIMNETRNRTTLSHLRSGSHVNLERAMPADGRFGGHLVTGHIDGTGLITQIRPDGQAIWFQVAADGKLLRYMIEKGSITIDGISLTIAARQQDCFSVSVIPHTFRQTILSGKRIGDRVNLEADCIGKYVVSLLPTEPTGSRITPELLNRFGF